MNKIIQTINVIISNSSKISKVFQKNKNEYFFLYNKYIWSISYSLLEDNYYIYCYPNNDNFEELVKIENISDSDINFISYNAKDLNISNALISFKDLYFLIREKSYKVDEIFDDIISDED